MIKQLLYNHGKLKLHSCNDENINSKIIIAKVLIFGSLERIDLKFEHKEIQLYFHINEDSHVKETPNFLYPRLKKLDENYFILSGLYKKQDEFLFGVGRFEGKIPNSFPQYQDEVKYPEDYWR